MSIGDSLFLSTALLSIVALFFATKDRWNWPRIAKWGLLGSFSVLLLCGFGVYLYNIWITRAVPQTAFWDININATPEDVLFLKGEPEFKKGSYWCYRIIPAGYAGYSKTDPFWYFVAFKEERVCLIAYKSNENDRWGYGAPIMGFQIGAPYEQLVKKMGEPSKITPTDNQLNRIYWFDQYNTFFSFQKGNLVAYGIYNPQDISGDLPFFYDIFSSRRPLPPLPPPPPRPTPRP